MRLIGRIVCLFKGHRRGKRISGPVGAMVNGQIVSVRMVDFFQCPRCDSTWMRKIQAKQKPEGNNGVPSDGSPRWEDVR